MVVFTKHAEGYIIALKGDSAMLEIISGRKKKPYDSREKFEIAYFTFLRKRGSARGLSDEIEEFNVKEGEETNRERARILSSSPSEWRQPDSSMVCGAIMQFKNLSGLARKMGTTPNTIQSWKKGVNKIPFFTWRYLLELLEIALPIENDLEMRQEEVEVN